MQNRKFAIVFLFPNDSTTTGPMVRSKLIKQSFFGDAEVFYGLDSVRTILKGMHKYDKIYLECSTQPHFILGGTRNFLTYLLINIFKELDKKCSEMVIFYRDTHWNYFRKSDSALKKIYKILMRPFFLLELKKLKGSNAKIAVPDTGMLQAWFSQDRLVEFIPGCATFLDRRIEKRDPKNIKLVYIGNTKSSQYNIEPLLKFLENHTHMELDIVTTKNPELEARTSELKNVSIKYGFEGLKSVGKSWDYFVDYRVKDPYLSFSMPLKIFEAVSMNLPVICPKGTKYGNFVEEFSLGACFANEEELLKILNGSTFNSFDVYVQTHSWRSRVNDCFTH